MKQLAEELYEYTKVVGSHNKHIQKVAKGLVDKLNESELTNDQREVLEWLQAYGDKDSGDNPFQTIWYFLDLAGNNGLGLAYQESFVKLNREQQAQVIQVFAAWALGQEQE